MSAEPVAQVWLKHGCAFMAYVWRRFVDDRCLGIASTLSYTSLLALVPLAAIAFAVFASALRRFADIGRKSAQRLF